MCDDVFEDPNDVDGIEDSEGWTNIIQPPTENDIQKDNEWFPEQKAVDPVTYWYLMQSDIGKE